MNPELPRGIDGPMQDVVSRTITAANLMLDAKMLDGMMEAQYPEQRGKHPEFGEEILKLAREMLELKLAKGEGCEVCSRKMARDGSGRLLKCGGCQKVEYCSVDCQKFDWKSQGHKLRCKSLKEKDGSS